MFTGSSSDVYASSLPQEPLPSLDQSPGAAVAHSSPIPALRCSKQPGKPESSTNVSAASRFVLKRKNAGLCKLLEEALGERDDARKILDVMRGLVGSS